MKLYIIIKRKDTRVTDLRNLQNRREVAYKEEISYC